MLFPTVGEGSEVNKVGWPTLMGRASAGARLRCMGRGRLRGKVEGHVQQGGPSNLVDLRSFSYSRK